MFVIAHMQLFSYNLIDEIFQCVVPMINTAAVSVSAASQKNRDVMEFGTASTEKTSLVVVSIHECDYLSCERFFVVVA